MPASASKTAPGPHIELLPFPEKSRALRLGLLGVGALGFVPPLWFQSIFGSVRSWRWPPREGSEFEIVDPRQPLRALRWLRGVTVPSAPHEPPEWLGSMLPPGLQEVFFHPTVPFSYPQPPPEPDPFPRERWFFIHGIVTDRALAELNAELLVRLFGRSLTVIQNATNSLLLDLLESAVGKGYKNDPVIEDEGTFTHPALVGTLAVLRAFEEDVDRIVVLAHSQGALIAANVLRAVSKALAAGQLRQWAPLSRERARCAADAVARALTLQADERTRGLRGELSRALRPFFTDPMETRRKVKKLEIYTFANPADKMQYVFRDRDGNPWPRLEHFANERDLVARLGVLSPWRDLVEVDGPLYMRRGAWGHLLNEHYLLDLQDHLANPDEISNPYPRRGRRGPARPRLYGYFGGRPAD